MILQKQPNRWSCLATSFAMVFNVPVSDLVNEIGHDGSEIIFPQYEDPMRRRSFHPQEFIYPALLRKLALVPIEAGAVLQAGNSVYPISFRVSNVTRMTYVMSEYEGVIVGAWGKNLHAAAWDKKIVHDPNGTKYASGDFSIREFIAVIPIE